MMVADSGLNNDQLRLTFHAQTGAGAAMTAGSWYGGGFYAFITKRDQVFITEMQRLYQLSYPFIIK